VDIAQLELLGKVAGIGGIAIGAVVLVVRSVVAKTSEIPAEQRAASLRLVAIGAFVIGALGIGAWVIAGVNGGQHASTRGADSPAIVGRGNVTVGPASPPATSTGSPSQTGVVPNATSKTEGNRSPAIISDGDVVVSPPTDSQRSNTKE